MYYKTANPAGLAMTLASSCRNGFKCFKQNDLVLLIMRIAYRLSSPMKAILLVILSIFTISSTLSAATYVTTSGSIQDILKTSGETHPYSGANLSAFAELTGADLPGADLTGADLPGADLTGADLTGAHLTGAYLNFTDFNSADLTGANLTNAYLAGAYLNGADLNGADLNGSWLIGADLTGADLTGASLTDTLLGGADLTGADLTGAHLIGADFYSTWLSYANLAYADLTNVSSVDTANWQNSNLYGATLPSGYNQAWFESEGASFVPEASSYALVLGGLALGLVALRRR